MVSIKTKLNDKEVCTKVNLKYSLPPTLHAAEKTLRLCLGLPFRKKTGGQVAYGYMYDEKTDTYYPNEEIFKLLYKARQYLLTSHSLREVTKWLNFKAEKLGVEALSHPGLEKIMIVRPPYSECLLPEAEKEKIIESLCQWNQKTTYTFLLMMNGNQRVKNKRQLNDDLIMI